MKVGDLVTLRWGEHPRSVGTIIKGPPGQNDGPGRKILWFGTGRTDWISETDLEKVND